MFGPNLQNYLRALLTTNGFASFEPLKKLRPINIMTPSFLELNSDGFPFQRPFLTSFGEIGRARADDDYEDFQPEPIIQYTDK